MQKKVVGLLGCTGMVGKGALQLLMRHQDSICFHLGGRSKERMQKAVSEIAYKENMHISYSEVDICDEAQLDEFCKTCDVIVNCAGPFSLIGDKVIKACIKNGKHCVDASGDESFIRQLTKQDLEAKERKLCCLVSAGINPGLSEIIPAYVMGEKFDKTDELNIFFMGKGELSLNATYDIVKAIISGTDQGATYSDKGKVAIANDFIRNYSFPEPAGNYLTYPSVSEQFVKMTSMYDVEKAYFYNAYEDRKILFQFMKIKAGMPYDTEEKVLNAAKELLESRRSKDGKVFAMLHLFAEGEKNQKHMKIIENFTFMSNGETLTGMIAAATGILVLSGKVSKYGCSHASEAISYNDLCSFLREDELVRITEEVIEYA